MKIANGTDAASFTCEQYPDTAYVCDLEGGPTGCMCTGVVKYGNWERRHPPGSDTDDSPAKWTEPLCLNGGTVPCTNAQFGNVVNGAKVCTCEPTLDYAPMRGTHAAQSTNANGYVVPTCLIQKLSVTSSQSAAQLWSYGTNAGGLGLIANFVFGPLGMKIAQHVVMHEFDKDNLVAMFQFNGLMSSAEATAATFDTYRTDNSPISNAVQTVFADNADALGQELTLLAAFNPTFVVHPRTFADIGVQCPSGYCVNQVRKGISSASFTCERYPETEHICSYEDSKDNCTCNGTVKYGNWGHVKGGSTTGEYVNESFTAGTAVSTSIQCNNAIFGNVVNGAKYCTCTPSSSTSMSRSSKPAFDATAGGVGYSTPTCLIATIGVRSSLSGVTLESLKPQGLDRGFVQFFLTNTIPALMNGDTLVTIGQEFDESTMMLTAQFQGGTTDVANGYSKTAATIESEKATQTNMKAILNSIIAADPLFSDFGAVQPEWTFAYAPYPGGTYVPYNCTGKWYTTTTPEPTTTGPTTTPEPTTPAATTTPAAATVTGGFTVTMADTSVVLGNATIKAEFESGMGSQIAASAGSSVSASDVDVTASEGATSRRLAEERRLGTSLQIDYTINTNSNLANSVTTSINTLTEDQVKTKVQTAVTSISSCSNCSNVVITAATITPASVATTTTAANTETSSARSHHVLAALVGGFLTLLAFFA